MIFFSILQRRKQGLKKKKSLASIQQNVSSPVTSNLEKSLSSLQKVLTTQREGLKATDLQRNQECQAQDCLSNGKDEKPVLPSRKLRTGSG